MEKQLSDFVKLLKKKKDNFSKEVIAFIVSWGILENPGLIKGKKQLSNKEAFKVLSEISSRLLENGANFNNPDYKYVKRLEFRKVPPIQRFNMLHSSFDIFSQSFKENTHITDEKLQSDKLRELLLEYLIAKDESIPYLLAEKLKNCYIKISCHVPYEDWYDLNLYIKQENFAYLNEHKDIVINFFKNHGPNFIQPLEDVVYVPSPENCYINIAYDPKGKIYKKIKNLRELLPRINYLTAREIDLAIELGKQEKLLASLRLLLILSEEVLNETFLTCFNDNDSLYKLGFKKKIEKLKTKGLVVDSHAFYTITELRNIFIHSMSKHNDQSSLIFDLEEVIQFIYDIVFFKVKLENSDDSR